MGELCRASFMSHCPCTSLWHAPGKLHRCLLRPVQGTNATKVQAWLEDKFSASPLVQQQEGEEQGRGSGASGSSSGAGAGSGGRASNKQQ